MFMMAITCQSKVENFHYSTTSTTEAADMWIWDCRLTGSNAGCMKTSSKYGWPSSVHVYISLYSNGGLGTFLIFLIYTVWIEG